MEKTSGRRKNGSAVSSKSGVPSFSLKEKRCGWAAKEANPWVWTADETANAKEVGIRQGGVSHGGSGGLRQGKSGVKQTYTARGATTKKKTIRSQRGTSRGGGLNNRGGSQKAHSRNKTKGEKKRHGSKGHAFRLQK